MFGQSSCRVFDVYSSVSARVGNQVLSCVKDAVLFLGTLDLTFSELVLSREDVL